VDGKVYSDCVSLRQMSDYEVIVDT